MEWDLIEHKWKSMTRRVRPDWPNPACSASPPPPPDAQDQSPPSVNGRAAGTVEQVARPDLPQFK